SQSEKLDARTDIYSCGVVLYEMATGHQPYPQESVPSLLRAILEREPVSVRSLNSAIPPELETIIHKAINKDPTLRYQSAHELKVDLQRLMSSRTIEFQPPPTKPLVS